MTDAILKRLAQDIFKAERVANENQFETGAVARGSLQIVASLLLRVTKELAEHGIVEDKNGKR